MLLWWLWRLQGRLCLLLGMLHCLCHWLLMDLCMVWGRLLLLLLLCWLLVLMLMLMLMLMLLLMLRLLWLLLLLVTTAR